MDSLKHILQRSRRGGSGVMIERLQTYVEKKHRFKPEISLSPRRINIYAPSAAEASVLRLDWANLRQLAGDDPRRVDVRIRKIQG